KKHVAGPVAGRTLGKGKITGQFFKFRAGGVDVLGERGRCNPQAKQDEGQKQGDFHDGGRVWDDGDEESTQNVPCFSVPRGALWKTLIFGACICKREPENFCAFWAIGPSTHLRC